MVNLELYRLFVIVAKEENITKASEILYISQPAVTKQIHKLESILNTKLFTRTNKGLKLTKVGEDLYNDLKNPIEKLNEIDKKYSKIKNINIGSHNHLFNIMFSSSINKYYLTHEDININLVNLETSKMLDMLNVGDLDIVFSKKAQTSNNLKFIKLGTLHDVFISSKDSKYAKKSLVKEDLNKEIIYGPRSYAQAFDRLKNIAGNTKLNVKNTSYNSILELVSKSDALGFITREYVNNLEEKGLIEVKTDFLLDEVEFGIYLNNNSFNELRKLIDIIKLDFRNN